MKLDGRVRVVRVVKGRGDAVGQGLIEALTVPIKAKFTRVPCEVKGKKGKGKGKENEKKEKVNRDVRPVRLFWKQAPTKK